jgi:endonuclease/exonuclease/phosphatase family metal-dependent hydrolase
VPAPEFTIASLNARWGLDVDDRPFGLAAAVEAFDADLIAVQEVFDPADGTNPLAAVAHEGGYELVGTPLSPSYLTPHPEITRDRALATGSWGIAFLSRLPVRSVTMVDLGRFIDRWDVADRTAIVAEVEVGDDVVTVATVHLSFALPNALAQLRVLHGELAGCERSVVVGDCNLWGPLAAATLGGRRRAVRGRTWPAHRPHSQLDHVLLAGRIEAVRGRVLPPVGSDHLPIEATLVVT